jgi:hypothetical protein
MDHQSVSPVARLVRHTFNRRNELARAGDRFEGLVLVIAIAVALLGLPFAAAVGSELYVSQSIESREQTSTRHQAVAVLLVDAPPFTGTIDRGSGVQTSEVPASWELPDGTVRTGEVTANDGAKVGHAVRIWVDDKGSVVGPPMSSVGAGLSAVMVAVLLWAALIGVMAGLYLLVRLANQRSCLRRWADEWAAIGPEWTRRTR